MISKFGPNFRREYLNLRGAKIWSSQYKPLAPKSQTPVLLLHGGMSQTEGIDRRMAPALKGFQIFAYDRAGHGRSPDVTGSFHFDFQYRETIAYLEDVVKVPAHLIGFSDGGIIALLVAIHRPDLVATITVIGANYNTQDVTPPEEWQPDDGEIEKYAKFSPDPPETLFAKIKKMAHIWKTEPNMSHEQLQSIKCPALVIAGDDDVMTIAHTNEIYENIPNARLAIIPGASHLVDKDQPEILHLVIKKFLADPEYPVTLSPLRRKPREAH